MSLKFLPRILTLLSLTCASTFLWGQAKITGNVTDASNGEPVIGATVTIKGTTLGAITDFEGNYIIEKVPVGEAIVSVSYVSYVTKNETILLRNGDNYRLKSQISPDQNILDEVVVVGYGVQKKKDLTGAVTSVGAEQFQKGNIATPEQLVMGKVAGVQITSNSGQPGSGSRIRIRGGSSLNASNDPLIVIDGVPVDNGTINGASNPLSLINPNDIENITIMKDASAAAIYGARGANGVILITTKKGTAGGKFSIELNSNNSISTVSKYVDVLTGDEFRSLVKSIGTNQQKNLLDTTSTISTDWQREIYRNAFSTDNNLSFTGGVANLPYRLNLGYLKQNGILLRSQMDRYAAGINL